MEAAKPFHFFLLRCYHLDSAELAKIFGASHVRFVNCSIDNKSRHTVVRTERSGQWLAKMSIFWPIFCTRRRLKKRVLVVAISDERAKPPPLPPKKSRARSNIRNETTAREKNAKSSGTRAKFHAASRMFGWISRLAVGYLAAVIGADSMRVVDS